MAPSLCWLNLASQSADKASQAAVLSSSTLPQMQGMVCTLNMDWVKVSAQCELAHLGNDRTLDASHFVSSSSQESCLCIPGKSKAI